MVNGHGRGWMGWVAAARVSAICALSAVGWAQAFWTQGVWAQSGTDGAIGGRVLNAAGAPVADAVVKVRGTESGVALGARSGQHGEFLVVRLPVGP